MSEFEDLVAKLQAAKAGLAEARKVLEVDIDAFWELQPKISEWLRLTYKTMDRYRLTRRLSELEERELELQDLTWDILSERDQVRPLIEAFAEEQIRSGAWKVTVEA